MHAQMVITKVEGIVALRPQAAHMTRALFLWNDATGNIATSPWMGWCNLVRKKLSGPTHVTIHLACSEYSPRPFNNFPIKFSNRIKQNNGNMIKCLLTEIGWAGWENIQMNALGHGIWTKKWS